MSGHIGGQVRALPFTGLATFPLVIIGLCLTALGALATRLKAKRTPSG
jgi:hypothetical protein